MGDKRAGIAVEELRTPPLSGTRCPDPKWAAGRALILGGPQYVLGARWLFMADGVVGVPGPPPVTVPPTPPPPEGGLPFVDEVADPATQAAGAPPEGAVSFVDEVND